MPALKLDAAELAELQHDLGEFATDPLGFVHWAFPWGEGELTGHEGPDTWQADTLELITERVRGGAGVSEAIQIAIASGHGIGKSALVSWIILWAISTFEDTRGVVTANTESQLRTKTWPELSKWHRRFIAGMLFECTATAIYSRDQAHEKTWRIDAIPWSERNTEAFAGLHNQDKRVVLIFDEASSIPDIIWETSEGALTDENTEMVWCVFGNPTRNSGRFRECFGRFKHRWITRQIDSRTARMTNKTQLAQWIADYGEDSDFARIRVRGIFPRAGSTQFIGSDLLDGAMSEEREPRASIHDPLVLGVDVARFGDDESTIVIRKGRDARTHPPIKLRVDTMALASKVAETANFYRADAVFVDGGGVGGGVVDRLRQLKVPHVFDIQFGGSADRSMPGMEKARYANKAAEMWGWMREWLKGGCLPIDDQDFRAQLEGREYGYVLIQGEEAIALEKKADMKKRGLSSPDIADGLALTFAYHVNRSTTAGRAAAGATPLVQSEYDPYADANAHGSRVLAEFDPYRDT